MINFLPLGYGEVYLLGKRYLKNVRLHDWSVGENHASKVSQVRLSQMASLTEN